MMAAHYKLFDILRAIEISLSEKGIAKIDVKEVSNRVECILNEDKRLSMTFEQAWKIEFERRMEKIPQRFGNIPVLFSDLKFNTRTANCLAAENINSIEALLCYSPHELLYIPNFGKTSLSEIQQEISRFNLPLYPWF